MLSIDHPASVKLLRKSLNLNNAANTAGLLDTTRNSVTSARNPKPYQRAKPPKIPHFACGSMPKADDPRVKGEDGLRYQSVKVKAHGWLLRGFQAKIGPRKPTLGIAGK